MCVRFTFVVNMWSEHGLLVTSMPLPGLLSLSRLPPVCPEQLLNNDLDFHVVQCCCHPPTLLHNRRDLADTTFTQWTNSLTNDGTRVGNGKCAPYPGKDSRQSDSHSVQSQGTKQSTLLGVDLCVPRNSYVKGLTPSSSECNLICN